MSKIKLRLITIVSLAILFVLTLSLAIGALPRTASAADAENYAPTSIFSASTGGTVGTNLPKSPVEGEKYYVQFSLADEGQVQFRRDLALKWFVAEDPDRYKDDETTDDDETAKTAEGSTLADPAVAKYFEMSFAFPEIKFETFTISFESAEENITKEGITTNTLVFKKDGTALKVYIRNSSFDEEEDDEEALPYVMITDATAVISIRIDEKQDCKAGEFAVYVKAGEAEEQYVEKFTNIGGYYLEYRSTSATTPSTPITFKSELLSDLPEEKDEEGNVIEPKQLVLMHAMNGQPFDVDKDGQVEDRAEPVLVLNEAIYSIRLGQQFSLTYEAIDVMRDVTVTRSYYLLTFDEDKNPVKPNRTADPDDVEHNYKSLSSSGYIMPPNDDSTDELAYVSIRFMLNDRTFKETYVYLTWYAAPDAKVVEQFGEGKDAYDYIIADREAEGPKYVGLEAMAEYTDENGETFKNVNVDKDGENAKAVKEYQQLLDDAAANVSAGDGAYLYLPSLRDLIKSDYADYRNLRFSIYYYKPNTVAGGSATSATSLRYNNLRFEVDRDGEYRMRIVAQDAASNTMKYYDEDSNQPVAITSSNVWDIKGIPEFTFTIEYKGPSIEEAGQQDEGRRDQTYNISKFDIVALSGYETEYSLYFIEEGRLPEGEDMKLPEYSTFVKELSDWVGENGKLTLKDAENKEAGEPLILREIAKYNSDITEDDDEWDDTDNDYGWEPDSSLSFRPQEVGIYLVKVVVTDGTIKGLQEEAWMAIIVRNPTDRVPGQSRWLQNNTTAIVLFAISAVLLIAIILLFVIKPSDKKVEEVDLSKLKGVKKKKE